MSTVNLGSVVGPAGPSVLVPVGTTENGIGKSYNELVACVDNEKMPYIFVATPNGLSSEYGLYFLKKLIGGETYQATFASGSSNFDFSSTDPDANMVFAT